jgi:hypothetical protein
VPAELKAIKLRQKSGVELGERTYQRIPQNFLLQKPSIATGIIPIIAPRIKTH